MTASSEQDPPPRRLAMARRGRGADVLGWVLTGFLLGAALAMALMLHVSRTPHATDEETAASEPTVIYTPPPVPRMLAPPRLAARAEPIAPFAPQPSPIGAVERPPVRAFAETERAPALRRGLAARRYAGEDDEQVAEDAASAGMTSRSLAARDDDGR